DLLKQLDNLRAQGLLTEEEYQAKRAEILARTQPQNIPELLRQLGQLRDQGIITPEEFEAKKKELLSRL
ncbi:MAG: SHOCT domain-containing protein, partial [Chloroflexia bacterium]